MRSIAWVWFFKNAICGILITSLFFIVAPPAWSKGERAAFESAKRNLVLVFPAISATESSEKVIGTGFFLCLPCSKASKNADLVLLVTCKHVLNEKGRVRLRFNSKTRGNLGSLVLDLHAEGATKNLFFAGDKRVDLAAILLESLPEKVDAGSFALSQILPENNWEAQDIGEGSPAVSVAPVYGYPGYSKNQFAVRYGRIALKSDEYWFNERDARIFEKANLVDIGLNHGSSGSPVFLAPEQGGTATLSTLKILGVVKGATDVPSGRDLGSGAQVEIPLTVTAIEPAASLKAFIDEIVKAISSRGYVLRKT